MGSIISAQNGQYTENNTLNLRPKKQQNPLTQADKLTWFVAGESTSSSLMAYTGNVWCDSAKDGGLKPDTFQNVTGRFGRSMLKQKLQQLWQSNHSRQLTNGGEGTICFYGYSFKDGKQSITPHSRLDLSVQKEILGIANLQAPLSWYPIGKNRMDTTEDCNSPRLVFALPEYAIIRLTMDDIEVGNARCPGSGPPCFLSVPIKDYDDLLQVKQFPIYLTHVDRMNIGQPEPYASTCTECFREVLKDLSAGIHQCEMTLQFAYKTAKVTTVSPQQTDTNSASPRLKRDNGKVKDLFDLSSKQSLRNSSLVLRHSNPSKCIVSPVLCSGQFSLVLPESWPFESFDYSSFQSFSLSNSGYMDRSNRDNHVAKKKKQKAKRRRFSSG